MKLKYVRLTEKGMQATNGRLSQALSHEHYGLLLISNLRTIKVSHPDWVEPIYVPLERVDNFSPLVEEHLK